MLTINNVHELSLTMETIALEANVLSNMVQTVKRLFPSLVDGVTASFSSITGLDKPNFNYTKLQSEVIKNLPSVQYVDLDKVKVKVPEGFDNDFITALQTCEQALTYMETVKSVFMKEFRVYLSAFISNKDDKISTRSNLHKFIAYSKDRNNINSAFTKLYKANSFDISSSYSTVVKRNADVQTVFDLFNSVSARLASLDISSVKAEVEDIVAFVDIIIKQAQGDKIENISPEAIKNIAEGVREIALQVETFSACYYRVKSILISVDEFTQTLNNRVS